MAQLSSIKRQTICFAIDTSLSMGGEKIASLNEGLSELFRLVKAHPAASASTDVVVVTFGTEVRTVIAFDSIAKRDAPRLSVGGATPMGEAVRRCAEVIDKLSSDRTQQPAIMVIATDGRMTDATEDAAALCHRLIHSNQLVVFPIAIGEDAAAQSLAQFAPDTNIKVTSVSAIAAVFRDLAQSIIMTAAPLSVFDKPAVPWNEAMRTNFQ